MENLKERLNSKITTLEEKNTISYPALNKNSIEIIRRNLKNQPLSFQLFDVVKSPSGGATVFSVPGLSGDEAKRELTGIILDYTMPRAYWSSSDPIEGTPPDCYSENSVVSHDGKSCAVCPYNSYGSRNGDSNAKACKESVVLFLLRNDNIMPLAVRIPVSSKARFQRYLTRLVGNMIPLSGVVTRITLEKTTNRIGQPYSLYNFEAVSMLSKEETDSAETFAKSFMECVNAETVKIDEVG